MVLTTIFGLIGLVLAVWVIIDVLGQKKMPKGTKVLWIVLALLFSIITGIVYYFMYKK